MVKATEITSKDVAFGELDFLSLLAVAGMSRSAFLSVAPFCLVCFKGIYLVLLQRLADVFMQKAQTLEILLLAVTFACQGTETLSHALRVEAWRFVSVPKGHSSRYFTQAKENEEILDVLYNQYSNLILVIKSEGLNCKLTFHKRKLLSHSFSVLVDLAICNK